MQIKPLTPAAPLSTPSQPVRPAPANDKPSEFSQLLKTAQAGTPASPTSHGQG
ncbi:MAG TPA: hypothetical protein VGF12_22465 [Roseateles sp.]|uniref:hypothetical protein n=1 Tax=Roseateles sp. TaxID=1971397 RepID=UPI002ED9292E